MSFVHLHTHSHYSFGRAAPSVRDLVRRAAELEMPSIALTDNNSIAGLSELIEAADEFDVQPILGCELDVLPSNHGAYQGRTHRLTLLVMNEVGYRNLVALLGKAHDQPEDLPPHIRFTDLENRLGGIIVLTGTPRGELYHWLREMNPPAVKDYLNRLHSMVDEGNLYFEIIEYPHPRTRKIMGQILDLSRFLRIPAVVTQNVHFIHPRDILAYCALVQPPRQLHPHWPLADADLPTRHMTSPQEMRKRFGFTPELLESSLEIARRCSFRFPTRTARVPVPEFERGQDAHSVLWDRAVRGASQRYGGLEKEVKLRLNEEYGDIRGLENQGLDLSEQYLLLADIMDFLRRENLAHGVGLGDWTHSIIAFCLGIVEVDPLAHGLEYRSPRRAAKRYPPFEFEVSSRGMERTIAFLRGKYGENTVVPVGRRVDWKRGALFQHLCRWAGLGGLNLTDYTGRRSGVAAPPTEPEEIESAPLAALSPESFLQHADEEIESEEASGQTHVDWVLHPDIPRDRSLSDPKVLAEATLTLHPCPKGFEAQRGHYVLSAEAVGSMVPLAPVPNGGRATQAGAEMLDQLQMPRILFHSFTPLNILEYAQECVRQETPSFSIGDIPLNDPTTFEVLGRGLTNGIPALHNITAKSLLRARRPRNIAELLDIHAQSRQRRAGDPRTEPAEFISDCVLGYRGAWLKAYYPIAFMASALTHFIQTQRSGGAQRPRFQILLREARKMRIPILGPDINFSVFPFSIERGAIRTGLMAVQGMGEHTYHEIERVRAGSQFTSLEDFCHRIDPQSVNQSQIVNLIKSGAFDILEPNRNKLLERYERVLKNTRPSRGGSGKSGVQLLLFDPEMFEDDEKGEGGRREESIPPPDPVQIIGFEQESLGYCITHDAMDSYRELMAGLRAITPFQINPKLEGKTVHVVGYIDHADRDSPLIEEESELILDLEGTVLKASSFAASSYARVQESRHPLLIQAVVQRHKGAECHLVAQRFYSLEDVRRVCRQVRTLRLSLGGEDRKTIAALRSLIKMYQGNTDVELEGKALGWFTLRGIRNTKVLCCPPLYWGLLSILSEHRVVYLDQNGHPIAHLYS